MYITDGVRFNADAVGAFNILRKYLSVSGKLLVGLVSHIFFFTDISDVPHNHTADVFFSTVFCNPSGHFVKVILYCILLFPVKSLDMFR